MARPAKSLEPAWLVGLLVQWGRIRDSKGLGWYTRCPMLQDGVRGQARSYDPVGYGAQDFKAVEQAIGELDAMRKMAVVRYFKPWHAPKIDAETPRDTDTWLYHLKIALAELEQSIPKPAEVGSREWLCAM